MKHANFSLKVSNCRNNRTAAPTASLISQGFFFQTLTYFLREKFALLFNFYGKFISNLFFPVKKTTFFKAVQRQVGKALAKIEICPLNLMFTFVNYVCLTIIFRFASLKSTN